MIDCSYFLKSTSRPLFERSLCVPKKYLSENTGDENNLEPAACKLRLPDEEKNYDLLIVTSTRIFAFFDIDNGQADKRGEIVEAMPQNAKGKRN